MSAKHTPVCAHGVRAPHECRECADEPSDAVIALQRIHDFADAAHTKDDGHCYALSEIVAMCRAALDRDTRSVEPAGYVDCIEAAQMLIAAQSPHMTYRNHAERRAYEKLRAAVAKATGSAS